MKRFILLLITSLCFIGVMWANPTKPVKQDNTTILGIKLGISEEELVNLLIKEEEQNNYFVQDSDHYYYINDYLAINFTVDFKYDKLVYLEGTLECASGDTIESAIIFNDFYKDTLKGYTKISNTSNFDLFVKNNILVYVKGRKIIFSDLKSVLTDIKNLANSDGTEYLK